MAEVKNVRFANQKEINIALDHFGGQVAEAWVYKYLSLFVGDIYIFTIAAEVDFDVNFAFLKVCKKYEVFFFQFFIVGKMEAITRF